MKNFKEKVTNFHYKKNLNFSDIPLFTAFLIPSVFYSIVINFKNFLYKVGVLKEKKAKPKVICIGNLTTGGVGKTPVVIEFCKYFSGCGKKTASLSRGYGGKLKGINVIKDFKNILINDPVLSGDEVQLIAKSSTAENNFACLTSSDRLKGANYAADTLGAEIIVMDDGFSNRKIKKDLTVLLFDVEKFIGNGFLLPLGPLREPLNQIKRADCIILINKNSTAPCENIQKFLEEKFKKPVFISKFKADYFYDIKTDKAIDIKDISDIFAFCAIGSPSQFYNYLKPFNLLDTKNFDDHYSYTKADIKDIADKAQKTGAKYIITTEKDAVKIKDFIPQDIQILAMKLKPEIDIKAILENTGNIAFL